MKIKEVSVENSNEKLRATCLYTNWCVRLQ
jgi:hypothetical protein